MLLSIYVQTVSTWTGTCECGFQFNKHGTYERKTPLYGVIFSIQRVYCPGCGKTHALIPCFVFPYSRVMASVKETAMRGICFENHTIEQLSELCGVEPSTIKRWWERFKAAADSLLQWLAGKLASSTRPATWLGGKYDSWRAKCRKLFTLFGLYRSTYHPEFLHSDFDLLCLMKPLVFLPTTRQSSRS